MLLAFLGLASPMGSLAMEGTCGPLGTDCQPTSSSFDKSGLVQMLVQLHADTDNNNSAVEMTKSASTDNSTHSEEDTHELSKPGYSYDGLPPLENVSALLVAKSMVTGTPINLSPATFNGETFTVLGYSATSNAYFCYKVVVGGHVSQMTRGVSQSWDNAKCEKEFRSDYELGRADTEARASKAQHFHGGDKCGHKPRSSKLTVMLDPSLSSLAMEVEETKVCEYDLFLKGPIDMLQPEEEKPIPPSVDNGKIFYIRGHSATSDTCFCYKLELGTILYQDSRGRSCRQTVNCEDQDHWNKIIGLHPVDSADGLTQSYSQGTADNGCRTHDKKRQADVTMISDKKATKLSIKVEEPTTACAYAVEISGPLAELLGESRESALEAQPFHAQRFHTRRPRP